MANSSRKPDLFGYSNFFVSEPRVKKICELLIKNNKPLHWGGASGRVQQLIKYKPETFTLLKESNFHLLTSGVESAFNKGLSFAGKGIVIEDVYNLVATTSKYDIDLHLSYMIGMPFDEIKYGENYVDKELDSVIQHFKKLMKMTVKVSLDLYCFTPYPNTLFLSKCEELGYIPPKNLEDWEVSVTTTGVNLPYISAKTQRKVNFIHSYILRMLSKNSRENFTGIFDDKRFFYSFVSFFLIILKLLAKMRWSMEFFSFPIEYLIIEKLRKLLKSGVL